MPAVQNFWFEVLAGRMAGRTARYLFTALVAGDILTTLFILNMGGIETNNGIMPGLNPVALVAVHPLLWVIALVLVALVALVVSEKLEVWILAGRAGPFAGILVLVLPIYFELAALAGNIEVISILYCR